MTIDIGFNILFIGEYMSWVAFYNHGILIYVQTPKL